MRKEYAEIVRCAFAAWATVGIMAVSSMAGAEEENRTAKLVCSQEGSGIIFAAAIPDIELFKSQNPTLTLIKAEEIGGGVAVRYQFEPGDITCVAAKE